MRFAARQPRLPAVSWNCARECRRPRPMVAALPGYVQDARSADALARRRSGVDGLYVDAAGLSADGRDGRKNWRRQSVAAQVRRCDAPTRAARARAAATLVCREGEQGIGTASALLWQICGGKMTNSGRARAAAALALLLLAGTLADANAPAGLAAGEATALCKLHLLLGAAADHAERLSTLAAEMAQRASARQATAKEALIGVNTTQAGGDVKTLADLVGAGDLAKRELLDAVRTAASASREASHAEGELDSFLQTLAALITNGTQRDGKSCLVGTESVDTWSHAHDTTTVARKGTIKELRAAACATASAYTQTEYKQAEKVTRDLAQVSSTIGIEETTGQIARGPTSEVGKQIERTAACPLLGTAGTAAGKGGLWSIGKEDVMLGLFVKLPKNTGDRSSAGTTLAIDKAAALRHGGTLATMAENLTQAIDATSTQGKMGQCSNAAKLLCDASTTDFDALVAGARAEAAAAAQQANEELAASEGPHDTEETGAEDQKSTPQGRRDTKQATKKSAQAGQNANKQAHKDADSATLGTYTQSAACGIAAALALTSANGNQRTLA
ncbi:hypothetical protein ERJ75_001271800 [Trypanosoma vivax]|nr:hypothetical protein ERJ75_001271800 [Trypanosoma vivax]